MQIDIIEIAGNWPDQHVLLARLRDALARTIAKLELQFAEDAEISIALSDNQHVQLLNKQFREIDRPTNVLSFPVDESMDIGHDKILVGGLLGDIILASEIIAEEAERDGKPFADHVVHLTIHGLLHLLGYVHDTDDDAQLMESLEIAVLAEMNIANPYDGEPDLNKHLEQPGPA